MSILSNIISFIGNGVRTWRSAARGEYGIQTEAMKKLRDEVLNGAPSSRADDVRNLRNDRKKVVKDINKAFKKIQGFKF